MAVKAKKKSTLRRTATKDLFHLLTNAIVKLDKDIGNLGNMVEQRERIAEQAVTIRRLLEEKADLGSKLAAAIRVADDRLEAPRVMRDPSNCRHTWMYDISRDADACLHCDITARDWYCK